MSDETQAAQGANTGEPAGAAGSSAFDAEAFLGEYESSGQPQQTGEPNNEDAAHIEWLRKQDLSKLPTDVRVKLEDPFLRQSTKKVNDLRIENDRKLAEITARQEALLSRIAERLGPQVSQDQDQLATIRERIAAGDTEAVEALFDAKFGPQIKAMSAQQKLEAAERLEPSLKDPQVQDAVSQVLAANPALGRVMAQNNYEAAEVVLVGIARSLQTEKLQSELSQLKASIPEMQKQAAKNALDAFRKKLSGLPATTSLAGKTQNTDTNPIAITMRDSARLAWKELGGSGE